MVSQGYCTIVYQDQRHNLQQNNKIETSSYLYLTGRARLENIWLKVMRVERSYHCVMNKSKTFSCLENSKKCISIKSTFWWPVM